MALGPDLHGNYQGPKKEVQCHIMPFPLSSKNFWMVVLLSTIGWTIGSINCPKECTCQYLAVSCTGKLLEEFPAIIPLDTRQLVLAENKLSYLPSLELNFLSDLIYLDCSSNTLGKDLDFTFVSMIKLIYLDLSFNNLTQVTFGTFSQLSSLVVLKLSDNPSLVKIEKDSFANNTLLRHLDVSRCSLMFIDTSTVRNLPNLRSLGIGENPWFCNCSFMDLCSWLKESGITIPDMLSHLSKGKIFSKLDLREVYYRVRNKVVDEWKTTFN
ncbi:leucine-rich repeat-containing protein 52-like [Vipera latastei]